MQLIKNIESVWIHSFSMEFSLATSIARIAACNFYFLFWKFYVIDKSFLVKPVFILQKDEPACGHGDVSGLKMRL